MNLRMGYEVEKKPALLFTFMSLPLFMCHLCLVVIKLREIVFRSQRELQAPPADVERYMSRRTQDNKDLFFLALAPGKSSIFQ